MSSRAPDWLRVVAGWVRSAPAREDALHELRRRWRGEPALPSGRLRRVLVLCHGNICRSPFAAALLAARAPELEVRSAGLHAGEGNSADPAAVACARRMGLSLASHRSARVDAARIAWADLILVMQGHHATAIAREWPQTASRVRLLGDYLAAPPYGLPDPWGEPDAVFDVVFARVRSAVDELARRIESRL